MPEISRSVHVPDAGGRLSSYVPSTLPAPAWALARPAVLAAVAGFADEKFAVRAASAVCRLLAGPVWDRSGAPDLAVLLTGERIDAAVESWTELSAPSRLTHRTTLRRVARANNGAQVSRIPHPGLARTARWWVAARGCGPLPVLVSAATRRGLMFHSLSWAGAEAQMVDGAALNSLLPPAHPCHRPGDPGTVQVVSSAARALRDAVDAEGTAPMPATGQPDPHPSGNKSASGKVRRASTRTATEKRVHGTSGMAELRRAARQAAAPPRPAGLAPLPDVPDEVAAAIASYRPLMMSEAVWARIGDATRWAFAAYRPPAPRWLSTHGGYVARYCAWVSATTGVSGTDRLDPVALLGDGLVDAYLRDGLCGKGSTVATVRAVLRRVVANMSDAPASIRYSRVPLQPPYTPAECAHWVFLARHQPTRAGRRALSAAVALGLGAGLDSRDQRLVRACDVVDVDIDGQPALAVAVAGTRARTVVVRAAYSPLLHEALDLHAAQGRAPDDLLHGKSPDRLKVVAAVSDAARTALGKGVGLSAARMRTTWLLAVACAPVPLAVLLAASGLATGRTLADLLPYCPPPDPHEVARLLHDLDTVAGVL